MSSKVDLRAKLKRLRRETHAPQVDAPRTRGTLSVGPLENLEPVRGEHGGFAQRLARFGGAHRHGNWALDDVDHVVERALAFLARDPALAGLDPRRAIYLDIETTGLSGGTGTTAFLVALGTFEQDGFHLWQGFLPGPEGERALLADVARRVRSRDALVSFFGKSFDRHRLEDKMRVHGIEPPFQGRPHLDLYHPLRRLYRGAFPDGRLATMERELCGVERVNDLPGRYAPEAWFDYLAGRAHALEEVFRHNADDVLSLVVLAAHLGRTLVEQRGDGGRLPGPEVERAAGLARLFAEHKDHETALAWTARALDLGAPDTPGARELHFLRGDLLRKSGDHAAARDAYARACAKRIDELALRAWIAIAKLAEHQLADTQNALDAVTHAQAILATGALSLAQAAARRLREELAHREARLRRKEGGRGGRGRRECSPQRRRERREEKGGPSARP